MGSTLRTLTIRTTATTTLAPRQGHQVYHKPHRLRDASTDNTNANAPRSTRLTPRSHPECGPAARADTTREFPQAQHRLRQRHHSSHHERADRPKRCSPRRTQGRRSKTCWQRSHRAAPTPSPDSTTPPGCNNCRQCRSDALTKERGSSSTASTPTARQPKCSPRESHSSNNKARAPPRRCRPPGQVGATPLAHRLATHTRATRRSHASHLRRRCRSKPCRRRLIPSSDPSGW